jgi:hypothetical protein
LPPPVAGAPPPAPAPAPAAPTIPAVCQTDPQCGFGLVCDNNHCSAPCTPTSCGPDRECRAGGHCALIPCTDPRAGACPLNSRCHPSNGVCERQACTTRAQCDSGICFRSRCYSHDAYCMP